uniref:Uncharacterized protein n=1 Tax=Anguilla anguilla TaxID=7936 RepID=A0A0E9PHG1_ANGAN
MKHGTNQQTLQTYLEWILMAVP